MLRDLIKEGGLYSLANLMSKGFSFLLLPFYTRFFLQSTIGIIDVLSVFGLFFTSLVCFQLNQGMGRYVADPDVSEEDKRRYGSTAILFTSAAYVLFCVIVNFMAPVFIEMLSADVKISRLTFALAVSGVSMTGIVYFIGVYLRFIRKPKAFAITTFLHGFLTTGLIFLLVLQFNMGINGVYLAPLISGPLIITVQLIAARENIILTIDSDKLKNLFKYSMPLIPAALAAVVLNFIDRFFIKEYLTFQDLGLYGIGYKFTTILHVIILGISAALGPIAFEKSKDIRVKEELSRIFRLFIAGGSIAVLSLSLFSYETLFIFTNPRYYPAQNLMPIFYISIFFGGFSMFSLGLQIERKTNLIGLIVILTSLLNVLLNYLLISEFQLFGAAVATLICVLMNNSILFAVSQRHYPIEFKYFKLIIMILTLIALIAAGNYLLPFLSLSWYFNVVIKLTLILIFIGIQSQSGLVNFQKIRALVK